MDPVGGGGHQRWRGVKEGREKAIVGDLDRRERETSEGGGGGRVMQSQQRYQGPLVASEKHRQTHSCLKHTADHI